MALHERRFRAPRLRGALAAGALARVAACRGGALPPHETPAARAAETGDPCDRSNPPITCLFREKPASSRPGGAPGR